MNAYYRVRPSWGYVVELRDFCDNVVEIYTAGNHQKDSQIYNARNPVDYNTLSRFARQTAREMLIEQGYSKGKIIYDSTLI